MGCLEFFFLGKREVEECCAGLKEGEGGCCEGLGWGEESGPSLMREGGLVGGEDLREGDGDQREGAGGRGFGFCVDV